VTADPGSVVLIGPTAGQVDAIGIAGERSPGLTARQVGPLDALKRLGHVKGDEVAQVYLGVPTHPPSGVQFPVRKLVAFDRFTLGAGRTRRIHVHIPQRQLKYWSSDMILKNRSGTLWSDEGTAPVHGR